MASDKEGDRSLSGYSSGDREGTGGGPGGPAGTGRNSGTNSGKSSSGFSGGGTQSGPGGNASKSGSAPSGSGGNAGGREGTGGGPGGPAGTGRTSGTNATGGGGGGARSVTSTKGYTGAGPTGGTPTPTRGLGLGLSPARSATTTPSAVTPSLAGTAVRAAATPTGFTPDFNRRPDLNPAVVADAKVQAALGTVRAFEHRTTPTDMSVYSKVFGGKTVAGLPEMSIREVMKYQTTMPRSRAVGAYQIKDLATAARRAGISLDTKFSVATQDRMAKALASYRMDRARKADGTVDPVEFARQLSKEWAAFPHPDTGKSHYPANNNTVGTVNDTIATAQGFISTPTATSATGPAAALEALTAPVQRPADRVVSKYLSPAAQQTSVAAQAVINDLRARDAAMGLGPSAGGAGPSGVTPMSAGVNYAGSTPPSPAPNFRAAENASMDAMAATNFGRSPTGFGTVGPDRQVSNTGASLTSLDAPGLRTRMGNNADIDAALRRGDPDALNPGYVGAGLSAAPTGPAPTGDRVAPSIPANRIGSAVAPDFTSTASASPATIGTPTGFGAVVNQPAGFTPPPSQALAPGPIGAGFASAVAPSIAALGSTPQPAGPPAASLTSRTVEQGLLNAPAAPVADTFQRDLAPRTVLRSVDEAALHTVPNLDEAPKAKVTVNPGVVLPTKTDIVDRVAAAVAAVVPTDTVNVRSGKRTARGSGRHSEFESALDFEQVTEDGRVRSYNNPADREIMERVALTGARNFGILSQGAGTKYMGGTAQHFDIATDAQLGARQDHEWSHGKGGTGTGYNEAPMHDQLAQARADYAARAAGGTGSTPGQPVGFKGFTNAPAGSPEPVVASGGAYPPAPGTERSAPGPTTTATTGPAPAGTGPATGPWGDDKPDKVTGPRAPEPLNQKQQIASWLTKIGLSIFGGTPGAVVTGVDLLAEAATGQGPIDRFWASTDNPQAGPSSKGLGDYTGFSGRGPTVGATEANKRAVDKYLKPKPATPAPPPPPAPVESAFNDPTWRPTPEQKWGTTLNKYSEYPYATA